MAKRGFRGLVGLVLSIGLLMTNSVTGVAAAYDSNMVSGTDLSTEHIVEPLTKLEKQNSEKKLKEADIYVANKRKDNQSSGVISPNSTGSSKVLSNRFPAYAQEKDVWCGPAAAFNAIKYVGKVTVDYEGNSLSQTTLASDTWLKTVSSGGQTTFGSNWPSTMNGWIPGNNYSRFLSSGYSATAWKDRLMKNVIYTIDKGFPVIADTKQHKGASSINLSPNYATKYYNDNVCNHYVVICGYDDVNKKLMFSDSHSSFPGLYWISLNDMASLTDDYGIVW